MRIFLLIMGLALAWPSFSQERPKKKKQQQISHKKPTPEQIRKFKELEKKQQTKS